MPIGTVYQIAPVYDVVSSVPGISGAAAAVTLAAEGTAGGPSDILLFSKPLYDFDAHGGPLVTYSPAVTLLGSVVRKATPTARAEGGHGELRPTTDTLLDVTTGEDPAAALDELPGTDLTNWRIEWAGFTLLVRGAAIPQGSGWLTLAVLTL